MSAAPQTATYTDDSLRDQRLAAAAIWERMIEPIPTLLGKLICVASFRERISGAYRHPKLDRILSPEVACRVLRESHEQLFAEWIGLFLDEQREDVKRYLATLRKDGAHELLLKVRVGLMPSSANPAARHAFLDDLQEILTAGANALQHAASGGRF